MKTNNYWETEKGIQKAILEYLDVTGWVVWRNNSGMVPTERAGGNRYMIRLGTAGLPDVLAIKGGKFLGVEVKNAKGKLRPSQEVMHERLRKAGALVLVARCVEDVQDFVKEL